VAQPAERGMSGRGDRTRAEGPGSVAGSPG
jgi:hypothetical protein